ncbi:hypothetical protein THRCLA_01199 [Thraustotheca clavata]|uniref:Pentacotripeptide-repeat region of PRORP domain-containing protein n=1 Tax=Thraustotheca clavata TaxID=74557 RepID=A0A1W0A906_9STRA|nr:hypothetical protein THRCLA_01199 [Thraustotheca clavata]
MLGRVWRSSVRVFSTDRLRACAAQGDWRKALQIMSELDKDGKPDALAYELAIEACGRDRQVDAMKTLKETMHKDKIVPTADTIDLFIQLYLHLEQPEQMIQLGIERLRRNEPISLTAYNSIIAACSEIRSLIYAQDILHALESHQEWKTPLGAAEMASLIHCFGKCRRPDFAMQTLHTMQDHSIIPDIEAYTHLVRAHITQGATDQALYVFSLCNADGIVLGESIYAATIDILCQKKAYWHATQLFQDMLSKDIIPTPFCLSKMILAYSRTKNRERAVEVWNRIKACEEPATISTFIGIMNDCITAGELDMAIEAFQELQKHYPMLPPAAYNMAIRAYGRKRDPNGAIQIMESLIEINGCPEDASTYIALFNALTRASDRLVEQNRNDITRYWNLMMTNVPQVEAAAYFSGAGAFASCGDISSLQELFAHITLHYPESEDRMYSGAISGFSKAEEDYTGYIRDYIDMQIERGITINEASVRAASSAYIKYEKWDDLLHLIKSLNIKAFHRPEVVIGDLIVKVLDAKYYPIARFAFKVSHANGFEPAIKNKPHYLHVLANDTQGPPEWGIAYNLAHDALAYFSINEDHAYAVCDAITVLFRARKYKLIARLWYRLNSKSRIPLPIDTYKHFIMSSFESGFADSAVTAGEELLKMLHEHHDNVADLAHASDVYSVIISTFLKYKKYKMVVKFYEEMQNFGLTPDAYAYGAALQSYAFLNQAGKVIDTLNSFENCMSATKINAKELSVLVSGAISACATQKNDEMIINLYEHMKTFELNPDSYAQGAIIRAYSRTNQLHKIREFQDSLIQGESRLNDRIVQSILTSYALAHDNVNLNATMCHFQYTGDQVLNLCFKTNKVAAVVNFMKNQGDAEQDNSWAKVSPAMQMSAIKWLLSRNAATEAADVCTFLLENGCKVADSVMDKTLNELNYHRLYDLGATLLDLFHKKQSLVTNSDAIITSTLLLYNNGQKYDHIQALLTSPRRVFNLEQYTLGMSFCVDGGAYSEAIDIYVAFQRRFIEPNGVVFCLALESCQELNEERIAKKILEDIEQSHFEAEIQTEMNRRLSHSLTKEAREIDPKLANRVAEFALYLYDLGFPLTKSFGEKLLERPTHSYLEPTTRARVGALLNTM